MTLFEQLKQGGAKLSVVGLGYVGMPLAVEFSKKIDVIGFDINEKKIEQYRHGIDATNEVGSEALRKCNVDFTTDAKRLKEASFHVVAVPTPINQDKTPDLTPVIGACETLGANLVPGSIVVFESTVYPGVTEDVCVPILENKSGLKCGRDFKVGYSPERINPGDRMHTLTTIKKIVSGMDTDSLEEIRNVYELIIEAGVFPVSTIKTAEAIKVVENSQRDINIAFMNELAMVFHRMEIDTNEVIDGMNTKWNALGFRPGLVGGHCIGVDPYYFTYEAEKLGYHSQIVLSGRKVNDDMGAFVAEETVKQLVKAGLAPRNARIAIMGLTFKEDCPDIRNTKVIDIVNNLAEYGIAPIIADPLADKEEAFRIYGIDLVDFEKIKDVDCLLIAVAHSQYKDMSIDQWDALFNIASPSGARVVVDVKGIVDPKEASRRGWSLWRL